VAPPGRGSLPKYLVAGSFFARRGYWQPFTKEHDAPSPETAREWAYSEIGGCHGVKRRGIRIDSVTESPGP
jgi:ribosomal protein L20A (L18A)